MNSDINTPSFHRTGKTWAWLLVATLLWLVTCLWALDYAGYSLASLRSQPGETPIAENQSEATRVEQEARQLAAAEETARLEEEARQLAAAEETARLEEEARQLAAAEEAARLEEEARQLAAAEEAARLEEEARQLAAAEEAARLEEEARQLAAAEETARLEEEARQLAAAEEAARLEEEARQLAAAEEAARLEEEARQAAAAEEATRAEEEARRIAAAEEAASAAALAEAARVAALLVEQSNENSQADEDVDDAARQVAEQQNIDAQAQQLAANEAARVAAVARKLREFEELRTQELLVLRGLSARTQFLAQDSSISRQLERTLDRMFDPLYLYSEPPVVVAVASNDGDQTVGNDDLSNDRALAIVDYLVSRGLERGRFRIQVESVGGMPVGTHRVRVIVLEDDQ